MHCLSLRWSSDRVQGGHDRLARHTLASQARRSFAVGSARTTATFWNLCWTDLACLSRVRRNTVAGLSGERHGCDSFRWVPRADRLARLEWRACRRRNGPPPLPCCRPRAPVRWAYTASSPTDRYGDAPLRRRHSSPNVPSRERLCLLADATGVEVVTHPPLDPPATPRDPSAVEPGARSRGWPGWQARSGRWTSVTPREPAARSSSGVGRFRFRSDRHMPVIAMSKSCARGCAEWLSDQHQTAGLTARIPRRRARRRHEFQ